MAQIGQIPGGGRAFGDIYTVQTPALDKLSNQLYYEQRQREAQQARNQQLLDAEFAKNLSGIRDVDIADLTKAYSNFKLANQSLMRQKGGGTPDQQLDLLRKKAQVYDIINASKNAREEEKEYRKGLQSHPDRYDDNAHDYLLERISTPIGSLGLSSKYKDANGNPIDLRNGQSYLYKGTDFDLGNALRKASGSPKNTPYQKEEALPGNLGKSVTNYQFGNNPLVFKEQLMGEFATNKGGRAAGPLWDAIPEDQKQLVDQMYKDIPPEKWERMTGSRTPIPLIVFNPNNKAELLANYQAKLHAINNDPVPIKTQQLYDRNAIMNKQEGFREKAADLRFQRAKVLVGLNKEGGGGINFDVIGNYIPKATQTPNGQLTVRVKDIDPYDYKTITNNGRVFPKTVNGEEVFIVDPNNGDFIGEDGQRISRQSVALQRSKETNNVLFKRGAPSLKEAPINTKNKWEQYKRKK